MEKISKKLRAGFKDDIKYHDVLQKIKNKLENSENLRVLGLEKSEIDLIKDMIRRKDQTQAPQKNQNR